MSIMASVVMMILLVLRFVLKKWLSKSMLVVLWVVVLVRLIIPFSIESPISIGNILGESTIKSIKVSDYIPDEVPIDLTFSNYVQLANDYVPISFERSKTAEYFDVVGMIWMSGLLLIGCYFLVVIFMLRQLKKDACVVNDLSESKVKCYKTDRVDTPMVIGIIKPFILMPIDDHNKLNEQLNKVILLHEKAHIRRKDNLWKLIFGIALCIHWFNPFIWFLSRIVSQDIELACDERVLKGLKPNERKYYGAVLLDYASKEKLHATAFGNSNLKNRIYAIINFKQKSLYMIAVTSFVCILLSYVLLTNPT
jgi:beta-lactamase regulating signal transducer with metallopeptidase domain